MRESGRLIARIMDVDLNAPRALVGRSRRFIRMKCSDDSPAVVARVQSIRLAASLSR